MTLRPSYDVQSLLARWLILKSSASIFWFSFSSMATRLFSVRSLVESLNGLAHQIRQRWAWIASGRWVTPALTYCTLLGLGGAVVFVGDFCEVEEKTQSVEDSYSSLDLAVLPGESGATLASGGSVYSLSCWQPDSAACRLLSSKSEGRPRENMR